LRSTPDSLGSDPSEFFADERDKPPHTNWRAGMGSCLRSGFWDTSVRAVVHMVGELDKGESGPFPGAAYELCVIHAGPPLGWRARCTILELESSNEQRTNRAEEL
jgi:hypothetical protein